MYTIESVKRDLPNVPIRVGKKIQYARITGRLNPVATVTVHGEYSHALKTPWRDWHFSWEAIVRALNTGEPLEGDE